MDNLRSLLQPAKPPRGQQHPGNQRQHGKFRQPRPVVHPEDPNTDGAQLRRACWSASGSSRLGPAVQSSGERLYRHYSMNAIRDRHFDSGCLFIGMSVHGNVMGKNEWMLPAFGVKRQGTAPAVQLQGNEQGASGAIMMGLAECPESNAGKLWLQQCSAVCLTQVDAQGRRAPSNKRARLTL